MKFAAFALALLAGTLSFASASSARSLEAIRERGVIRQCAHPNALPFASRHANPPGFQLELGEALAKQLGVALEPVWIIGPRQFRAADCDIVTDVIADAEAQGETGLTISKPYYRTGVVLVVPGGHVVANIASVDRHAKIGVLVASMAAMALRQAGYTTSTFGFEDDILRALTSGEIGAAAVSRAAAGYFMHTHPDTMMHVVDIASFAPGLGWNVAIGMMKPDAKLREAIDAALERLLANGTIQRIYARYGVTLLAPQ